MENIKVGDSIIIKVVVTEIRVNKNGRAYLVKEDDNSFTNYILIKENSIVKADS